MATILIFSSVGYHPTANITDKAIMRKFLLTTAAVAATLSISAINPASVSKLTNAVNSSEHVQRIERNLDIRKHSDRQQRVKARRHAAPLMKAVPGPGADDKVID